MNRPVVCVVGEVLWDHHANGPLETASRFERVVGGAAANVALHLNAREVPTAVVGVVGDDVLGDGLRGALENAGVDISAMTLRPGQTGSVFIEPMYEGVQRFYSYRPTVCWPAKVALPQAWRRGSLEGCALHVAALNPHEIAAMEYLASRVSRRGARVSIDANARPRAWRGERMTRESTQTLRALFAHATWVKASEEDLDVIGVPDDRERIGMAAEATLIVTRGSRDVTVAGPNGLANLRPKKQRTERCSGAGDAFSAGLLAYGLQEAPRSMAAWKRAVRFACAAAAEHLQRASPK